MRAPIPNGYACRYLVRFDFGPNGRLNEVEIFPDLFGGTVAMLVSRYRVCDERSLYDPPFVTQNTGPDCDLRSQSWAMFRDELSDALVRSVHRALTRSV